MTDSQTRSAGVGPETLCIYFSSIVTVRSKSGPASPGGGGGGLYTRVRLAKELVRRGHLVTVLTNTAGAFEGSCTRLVEVGRARSQMPGNDAGSLLDLLRTTTSLKKELATSDAMIRSSRRLGTSIILAASANLPDVLLALRLSRRLASPVVISFHHLTPGPVWFPHRRGGFVRCTAAWSLSVFALLTSKIFGFYPAIDQPREISDRGWRFQRPVFQDEGFLEGDPDPLLAQNLSRPLDACFISRLSPYKGLSDLVPMWDVVTQNLPGTRLVVGGDFESTRVEERFLRQVRSHGLGEAITLRGHTSKDEKEKILRSAKVFVFPSYEEGWSLSVMEAAAWGAVPIVYDLPAYDYLGPALPRARPGSVADLAALTVRMLRDPGRRQETALNLQRNVQMFTAERATTRLVNYFKEVATSFRPTRD